MSPIVRLENVQQFQAIQYGVDAGAVGGPIIVPSCAQVVFNWALPDGKTGHNVLYGRYAGAFHGTQAECNAIFTQVFNSAAFTALRAHMPPGLSASGVSIRDVNAAYQPLVTSNASAVVGTSAGAALPSEVSAVVTERTALAGRQNRGRIYIPGWAATALGAGDVILAAVVTLLQTWASTLPSALAGSGYTLVIGQKARGAYTGTTGVPHPPRLAGSVPVTSLEVRDNHWDSQRRRGLK
jgi:hypothetical protein